MGIHPEVMLPLVVFCLFGFMLPAWQPFEREGKGDFGVRGKGKGHARKEGGRSRGKHLEGVVIFLLEVASCHRNLSGCSVVMLPQVDNLTKMLKRSDIKPVKVFGLSDILQLVCIRTFNKCACYCW